MQAVHLRQCAKMRSITVIAAIGVPLLGYWHGSILHNALANQTATLEVEAEISRGSRIQIYFNNQWSEPRSARVSNPGRWEVFRFQVPSRLRALRLDPSDVAGSTVRIRSVRLVNATGKSSSLLMTAMEQWGRTGVDFAMEPSGVRITTQSTDAYLLGGVDLDVSEHTFFPFWLKLNTTGLLWVFLIFGAVIAASSISGSVGRAMGVVAIIVVSIITIYRMALALQPLMKVYSGVSAAVGFASYHAYPKPGELRAVNLALLAGMILAGFAAALLFHRQRRQAPFSIQAKWTRREYAVLLGAVVLFAIAALPTSQQAFFAALHAKHVVNFDSENILYWDYAAAKGELPFRDFWYPYTGMYDKAAPLYPNLANAWLLNILTFTVLAVSVFVVLRRSVIAAASVWLLLIALHAIGVFWTAGMWRYLISASIVLLAAAALELRTWWMGAALGLWIVRALAEEISQPLFAAPAVAVLVGATLYRNRTRWREFRAAAAAFAASFGVAFVIYFGMLIYRGQFAGWWSFIRELSLVGDYAGWPLYLKSWLKIPDNIQQFYILLVALALVTGAIHAVQSRFSSPALLAPLGLTLLSWLHLQKEIIRPGIAAQIVVIPVLGLAILVAQIVQQQRRAGRRNAWWVAAYCGPVILTVFFLKDAVGRSALRTEADIASGLSSDLAYTFDHRQDWGRAVEHFFSPQALDFDGLRGDALRDLLRSAMGPRSTQSIFVFGDRPDVYMLLRAPSPYYVTFYNQSPLPAQENTVNWLESRKPEWALWDARATEFDSVPNAVRVPILYRYMVAHYNPVRMTGAFHILRRRSPSEPANAAFWRNMLGQFFPLGYIPSLSQAEKLAAADGRVRARFMLIRSAFPIEGRTRTVRLTFAGQSLAVQFIERAGIESYPINIERLPYAGLDCEFPIIASAHEDGIEIRTATLTFDAEPLY